MTNPTGAMRMLITYAVCIPVAIVVGWLLTNPLDYGTLGFLGLLIGVLVSPIFIQYYYPILVFALSCPMVCFFIPGRPPLAQLMVVIALTVAITQRILTGEQRFMKVPVMTWPLLYIGGVIYMTAELNDGIHLHSMGGDNGGGRKYIDIFLGIGVFFALVTQTIPRRRRNLYLMLYMLTGLLGLISNLFPYLPSPLNKINLLFPPVMISQESIDLGTTRLTTFSFAVGTIMCFMLAKYGLRGIFSAHHFWRPLVFGASFMLSMLGGFRSSLIGMMIMLTLMFFLEGMHRSRLMPAIILGGILGVTVLATCSDKLPFTFQRSMSFLPLKWNENVIVDAQASSDWRYNMWRATWPQVPSHLLLGKGYTISKEDYDMMGGGQFVNMSASHIDAANEALALSGDYHSGPLGTLMPFGIWGGIGILWLFAATLAVLYRNYRYGDPEVHTLNIYLLATCVSSIIAFFFIFGSFKDCMASYGGMAGFSLAMNGGLGRRPARAASNPRIKPLSMTAAQPV